MTVEEPDIRQAVAGTKNKAVDYNHNFGEINRYVTEKETENAGNIDNISATVNNLGNKVNANRTLTITGVVSGEASFNLGTSNQITLSVEPSTLFNLIMPSYLDAVEINQPISSDRFTAFKAGIYYFYSESNASKRKLYVNDLEIGAFYYNDGSGDARHISMTVLLSEGDEIYWSGNRWTSKNTFVPLKGA